MSDAIWCSKLVKTFGATRALDGLDLAVATGEVHGFLGPNGSGKTVTMRILLGLLRRDAGEVRLLGADPWTASVELHRRLAYVPGDTNLWPTLTGGEVIDLLGRLRGGLSATRRAGPAEAATWITRPAGLALRLQRATIIGWSVGLLVTGLVFGAVGNDVGRLLEDNPDLTRYLEQFAGVSITDAYFTTALQMMALLAAGFALSSILRARTEEMAGRAEPIVATSTSRTAWWTGQVAITAGGTLFVTLSGGLGVGVAYGIVARDMEQVPRLALASMATLPAVFVLIGAALALTGSCPVGCFSYGAYSRPSS